MSTDSDLYGEDIHLWSETQAALLRRLAAGEAVRDQVDWTHVVEEIEDLGRNPHEPPDAREEIARLTALLTAAEARVRDLRAQLDALTSSFSDVETELAAAQGEAQAANARAAAAAEAQQTIRQADVDRRAKGLLARLRAAWRGE